MGLALGWATFGIFSCRGCVVDFFQAKPVPGGRNLFSAPPLAAPPLAAPPRGVYVLSEFGLQRLPFVALCFGTWLCESSFGCLCVHTEPQTLVARVVRIGADAKALRLL